MEPVERKGRRAAAAAAVCAVVLLALMPTFGREVRVTVHPGETHKFWGVGGSATLITDEDVAIYAALPESMRKEMAEFFWHDGGFRILRVWTGSDVTPDGLYEHYGLFVRDALAANPDMVLLMGPVEPKQGAVTHAAVVSQQIKKFKDEGLNFEATGVCNEANVVGVGPDQITDLVIKFRQALDGLGLDDVKVIAPEVSNVDAGGIRLIDALIANKQALDALGGFATHSYSMCMVKSLYDEERPYGKEHWQTESSGNGPEPFDDDAKAASFTARIPSDANLGVTHWCYFIAYTEFDPSDNTTRVMGFDPAAHTYQPFLKYYYMQQFNHTITPGTAMRLCESDLGGGEVYQWMENSYGDQPPICACAGVNPDGSWGLVVVNKTHNSTTWNGYLPAPEETFEVTFAVEELASEGDMEFNVYRSDKAAHFEDAGTATMHNGEITLTASTKTIVSARNADAKTVLKARDVAVRPDHTPPAMSASVLPSGRVAIRFCVSTRGQGVEPVRLVAYDLAGRLVREVVNARLGPGEHRVTWDGNATDGRRVFASAYVVRLFCGSALSSSSIVLR